MLYHDGPERRLGPDFRSRTRIILSEAKGFAQSPVPQNIPDIRQHSSDKGIKRNRDRHQISAASAGSSLIRFRKAVTRWSSARG